MRRGILILSLTAWTALLAWTALGQTDDATILNKYKVLESRIEKARIFFLAENYAKCEKEAAGCLEALPDHHEAHFFMAQVLYKRGEFNKALEQMLSAESGFVRLQDIVDRVQQKKFEKQLDKKVDLAEQLEDWGAALQQTTCMKGVYQGIVLDKQGKLDAESKYSESDLAKAQARLPAEYAYFHGNCLFRLKKSAEAEDEYKVAIQIDPRHANAYNNLINLLYLQKRLAEARTLISQAEANNVAIVPGLKNAVFNNGGK
jgi:Tfp pilus assembly protein PilF